MLTEREALALLIQDAEALVADILRDPTVLTNPIFQAKARLFLTEGRFALRDNDMEPIGIPIWSDALRLAAREA